MRLKKAYLITVLIVIVAAAGAASLGVLLSKKPSQQYARPIPEGTYFATVRKLSAGKKPACLARDAALDNIVQADDKLPFEKSMSPALGMVIPDMPAGHTTTYLHTYTPTSATGYEIFSDKNQQSFVGDLKSFNFSVQRSSANAPWKLASFIACSE